MFYSFALNIRVKASIERRKISLFCFIDKTQLYAKEDDKTIYRNAVNGIFSGLGLNLLIHLFLCFCEY